MRPCERGALLEGVDMVRCEPVLHETRSGYQIIAGEDRWVNGSGDEEVSLGRDVPALRPGDARCTFSPFFNSSGVNPTRMDAPMVHFTRALRHRWHGLFVEVIKSRLQRSLWLRQRSQA